MNQPDGGGEKRKERIMKQEFFSLITGDNLHGSTAYKNETSQSNP